MDLIVPAGGLKDDNYLKDQLPAMKGGGDAKSELQPLQIAFSLLRAQKMCY